MLDVYDLIIPVISRLSSFSWNNLRPLLWRTDFQKAQSLTWISPWKNTTCLLLLFSFDPESNPESWPSVSGRRSSRSFTRLGSDPGTASSFWSLCRELPQYASRLANVPSPHVSEDVVAVTDVIVLAIIVSVKPTEAARTASMNPKMIWRFLLLNAAASWRRCQLAN